MYEYSRRGYKLIHIPVGTGDEVGGQPRQSVWICLLVGTQYNTGNAIYNVRLTRLLDDVISGKCLSYINIGFLRAWLFWCCTIR
jgi:hypothetical protein